MPKNHPSRPFDAKAFLAKGGSGEIQINLCRGQSTFAQGDAADAVFHIARGGVELGGTSQGRRYVQSLADRLCHSSS
jgi:hypothetical protein